MILESGTRVDQDPAKATPAGGDETLVIVQSLICMLREKNLLTRADIEELCHRVELRAAGHDPALPCSVVGALSASSAMTRISTYLGQRYGGKHARGLK